MQITNFKRPFEIFKNWQDDAVGNKSIVEPTAMCISSVDIKGNPSSRMVLLKNFNDGGFYFYTNLNSRKANQLNVNPNICACFYWGALHRQVRIEGSIEEVSEQEADDYFSSRARGSQIGAWASDQSSELTSKEDLQAKIKEFENKFEGQEVPRPPEWSGFKIIPDRIEFWQEGEFRIHDRKLFKLSEDKKSWIKTLLSP